jgi:hypothetical protein
MSSNTRGYIITTQSGTLNEYTPSIAGRGIPIVPTGRVRQPNPTIPYTLVDGLYSKFPIGTGSLTAETGGGGGGIPAGITARDQLVHWWKLSDGSATTGTDYGLSASAGVSDLTLDGVTTDAAGPSENGTPAAISFDGVNDSANVKLVDSGGTNTVVGDLIDTGGGFTLSLWIKDEKSPNYDSFDAWWQASSDSGLMSNNGFGGYAVANTLYSSIKLANGYRAIEGGAYPTSGYKNWIITYPDPADGSGRRMNVYFDGSEVAFLSITDATVTTAIPATANTRLSFGCITAPDGTTSRHTAPTLSDIRLYNKVLSGAEISAIAAGDWE